MNCNCLSGTTYQHMHCLQYSMGELPHDQEPLLQGSGHAADLKAGPLERENRYVRQCRISLRLCCWGAVLCSAICFLFISFARATDWYSQNKAIKDVQDHMTLRLDNVEVLTETIFEDGKAVTKQVGQDVPLWLGSNAFPVTVQWGAVLVATLCAAIMMQLNCWYPTSIVSNHPHYKSYSHGPSWSCRMHSRVKHTVTRLALYQLPPHDFWSWWCGGLTVLDAAFVTAWAWLCGLYLYCNIARKFRKVPLTDEAALTAAVILKRLKGVSKAFGETMRGTLCLMFIPISRSSFLQWLTGNDFSTLIKYHRWMSWGNMMLMYIHSIMYVVIWLAGGELLDKLSVSTEKGRRNLIGLAATLTATAVVITSTAWARKHHYKLFYRTHIIGFVGFTSFSLMHYKNLINWIAPGLVFYGLDRAFRYWQLASNWTRISLSDMVTDGNIMTLYLTFNKGQIPIQPGQTVYLRFPAVSLLTSHPFSVADAEPYFNKTRVVVHMRVGGPWTSAVQKYLLSGKTLSLQLEGPYESKLSFVEAKPHHCVVMIAGGIGVTPLLGTLRHLLRRAADPTAPAMPQVHFLWSCRSLCELRLLGADLLTALTAGGASTDSISHVKHQASSSLDDGSGSDGEQQWLHGDLYYTGFEHENMLKVLDIPTGNSTSTGEITKARCALAAHPSCQPVLYSACAVVSSLGAWAGLLAASYYDAYYLRTTAEGSNYLLVGVLQWILVAVGAVLPPLAMLALANFFQPDRLQTIPSSNDIQTEKKPPLEVLPGYVLSTSSEHACNLDLKRGRPNMHAFLRKVAAEHGDQQQIDVLVASPNSMYIAVQQACADCSTTTGPLLVCKRVAHLH